MNIILLGKPGCGKGTQANIISKKHKLHHLATGVYFREQIKLGTKLGKKIEERMNTSNLVPDDLTNEVVAKAIDKFNHESILFDGYPRTIPELEFLNNFLKKPINHVILLDISDKTAIKRIEGRQKSDPRTESSTKDKIQGRLKVFNQLTLPVIEYYKKQGILKVVNGESTIDKITKEIESII